MRCFVGVDLGSTTTKAVILDQGEQILGRGITNSRSNYDVAAAVARTEAWISARFGLLRQRLEDDDETAPVVPHYLPALERAFRYVQHRQQLEELAQAFSRNVERFAGAALLSDAEAALAWIVEQMHHSAEELYQGEKKRGSDFFRDIVASQFSAFAQQKAQRSGVTFDVLQSVFDKSILEVENLSLALDFGANIEPALERTHALLADLPASVRRPLERHVVHSAEVQLDETNSVGTGYGRARLPFPKSQIRSEILCHGLGAHRMFPRTATVLDIGGQDTKAIQVDEQGIVTSFQMNDRCAAGCGRYLGYIADEMNLGLHELGPMAMKSCRPVRINSTCTVFAGAELRDRLMLGERREDILLGLHRAIILRAMSLLARSGGIEEEFTFTGGVAKNQAAVEALRGLVEENYGERTINISPDSIYTGALGAALFAQRDAARTVEEAVA